MMARTTQGRAFRSRPAIAAVAALVVLTLSLPPLAAAAAEAKTAGAEAAVAIVGATLVDGNGGPPLPDAVVVVTGGRIAAAGARAAVRIPPGARIVEAAGKFVVPGFIDTNVHLSLYGAGETFVRYEPRNADLVLEAAQLSLKHGVTTVRDSYGSLLPLVEIRDAIARGELVGPRILAAGNIVGWGGPYSVTFSQTQDTNLTLFQEQINDFITQGTGQELFDLKPEELRAAIGRYLDKGPDFIKYGGTAHFEYPTLIAFSPAQQRVLVEEAHKRGKVAETHATNSESLRIAVEAGLDLIQHPEVLSDPYPDDLIRTIRDRRIVCSILSNTISGEPWRKHLKDQEERKKRQAEAEAEKRDRTSETRRARTTAELRKERRDAGASLEARRANARKLIEAGCLVSASTDNYLGTAPEFRREPKPLWQEAGTGTLAAIEGLVELGMTPAQAIVAATKNGAIACRGLEEFGTLETGKRADLLVLDADPLADIANIRKLSLVMRDGRIVDRDRLPERPVWYGRPAGVPPGRDKS